MDPLTQIFSLSSIQTEQITINVVIILILVVLSAFFSATETAITCCNKIRIKVKAEKGHKASKLVLKICDMYDRYLITILIGNNIVNLLAASLATTLALTLFSSEVLATTLSTIIMTVLIFMFGEILPKNFAKSHAEGFAYLSCYILTLLYYITYPLMMVFNFILWSFKKIFKVKDTENNITEDEFQGIVDAIEEEGRIDEEESDIIQAAVDFGDITVKDVLTPIDEIISVDIKKFGRKDLINYLQNVNYSRVPVYEKQKDNIIGILHVRKVLKNIIKNRNLSIRSAISEVFYANHNLKIDEMLEVFKEQKKHLAIVKNDDNQIIGLVTMEDVLNQLIGTSENPDKIGGSK